MSTTPGTASQPAGGESRGASRALTAVHAPVIQRECACGGTGSCDNCKKKQEQQPQAKPALQRSAAGPAQAATAPPIVNHVLASPGRPLDAGARSFMEPRFGRDFSGVRVHTDPQAAESARAVNAHAYTVGQNIVFDSGRYDPQAATGRKLLAHELAHTVQQRNVHSAPDVLPLRETPEYNHLENEADSVAQAVLNHGGMAAPPLSARGPVLSRVDNKNIQPPKPAAPAAATNKRQPDADSATGASTPAVPGEKSERNWQTVTTADLKAKKVKAYAFPAQKTGIVAVQMDVPLELPPEKGPVLKLWQDRAGAGALEAIVEPGTGSVKTRAGLKQDRPDSKELRRIWLQKVGWQSKNAPQYWKTAGGDAADFDPPKAGGATCQVDHILELQFGGNNTPDNMQMLDGKENEFSGRTIFARLKTKAEEIKAAFQSDKIDVTGVTDILIHFDKVTSDGGYTCRECCKAEQKAKTMPKDVDTAKGQSVDAKVTGTSYPLKAGSMEAKVIVTDEKSKKVPIADSDIPENKSASTLISGFSLQQWNRPTPAAGGTVDAVLDTASRFPESLKPDKGKKVALHRGTDGTLKLPAGNPNLKFHFDYLSEGTFTKLAIEEDRYLVGSGTIKPSISFLPTFDVRFDKDKFELVKPIPADKLKLPIPGLKIKPAEIMLQIAPEFKPEGKVEFSLDAGKRHLLDGAITLSADANGLVAAGDVQVSLPGVDNAGGHIEYRNREWSGKAEINAAQLQSKLKYVKSGSLVVLFNKDGMHADGTVMLDLPGTKGVEAKLLYESAGRHWVFKGKGLFQPPGLNETEISITYDGDHLTGQGTTGFTFHGINGTISIVYRDERFSGEGKLSIDKGRAKGSLHVKMREQDGKPIFSGDGEISYQVTENLIAKAGIEIDEKQKVKLKGALEFPKPIKLFDAAKGDYKIFEVGISIPIPGASIGPVGLKARIDGSLSAGYQIGPGELRNTKIEATFNPLDDKPDVDVIFTSTLYIGAHAYISGRIEGSIVLDAFIGEVSGGLAITATASLDGHVSSEVTLHYQKSRFEADAKFEMLVGLALTLALDAFVKARAGIGYFSIEKRKDWNLASYRYDTGLQFGMKLKNPLHYASDQPVKLPTLDDIEFIKPDIKAGDMLEKIFGGAGGKEKEA